MPPRPANAADAANTELTFRSLYAVFTLVSLPEINALGTTALKNVWLNSNTDEAASSKSQWARFRERSLIGFICQLAPISWDLAMAYAVMRIAADAANHTDLEALGFFFSNMDFMQELVDPLWTHLHVHGLTRATFSYTAFFDDAHHYPRTVAELTLEQLVLYSARARKAIVAALNVMFLPGGDLRYIMEGLELLNGAVDPVGSLALIAQHFLSLSDGATAKNALADYLSIRPREGEHMRNFLQRFQEVRKILTDELIATRGTPLTTQSVADHVKFTIEQVRFNAYRAVFSENKEPITNPALLIKLMTELRLYDNVELGHKGENNDSLSLGVNAVFGTESTVAIVPRRARSEPRPRLLLGPTRSNSSSDLRNNHRNDPKDRHRGDDRTRSSRSDNRRPATDSSRPGRQSDRSQHTKPTIRIVIDPTTKRPVGDWMDGMTRCRLDVNGEPCDGPHYHHQCKKGKGPPLRFGRHDRAPGGFRAHLLTLNEALEEDEVESADEPLTVSMNEFRQFDNRLIARAESEDASSSTEELVSSLYTDTADYVYSSADYPDDESGADSTASTEDYTTYDYAKWDDYKDQEHSPSFVRAIVSPTPAAFAVSHTEATAEVTVRDDVGVPFHMNNLTLAGHTARHAIPSATSSTDVVPDSDPDTSTCLGFEDAKALQQWKGKSGSSASSSASTGSGGASFARTSCFTGVGAMLLVLILALSVQFGSASSTGQPTSAFTTENADLRVRRFSENTMSEGNRGHAAADAYNRAMNASAHDSRDSGPHVYTLTFAADVVSEYNMIQKIIAAGAITDAGVARLGATTLADYIAGTGKTVYEDVNRCIPAVVQHILNVLFSPPCPGTPTMLAFDVDVTKGYCALSWATDLDTAPFRKALPITLAERVFTLGILDWAELEQFPAPAIVIPSLAATRVRAPPDARTLTITTRWSQMWIGTSNQPPSWNGFRPIHTVFNYARAARVAIASNIDLAPYKWIKVAWQTTNCVGLIVRDIAGESFLLIARSYLRQRARQYYVQDGLVMWARGQHIAGLTKTSVRAWSLFKFFIRVVGATSTHSDQLEVRNLSAEFLLHANDRNDLNIEVRNLSASLATASDLTRWDQAVARPSFNCSAWAAAVQHEYNRLNHRGDTATHARIDLRQFDVGNTSAECGMIYASALTNASDTNGVYVSTALAGASPPYAGYALSVKGALTFCGTISKLVPMYWLFFLLLGISGALGGFNSFLQQAGVLDRAFGRPLDRSETAWMAECVRAIQRARHALHTLIGLLRPHTTKGGYNDYLPVALQTSILRVVNAVAAVHASACPERPDVNDGSGSFGEPPCEPDSMCKPCSPRKPRSPARRSRQARPGWHEEVLPPGDELPVDAVGAIVDGQLPGVVDVADSQCDVPCPNHARSYRPANPSPPPPPPPPLPVGTGRWDNEHDNIFTHDDTGDPLTIDRTVKTEMTPVSTRSVAARRHTVGWVGHNAQRLVDYQTRSCFTNLTFAVGTTLNTKDFTNDLPGISGESNVCQATVAFRVYGVRYKFTAEDPNVKSAIELACWSAAPTARDAVPYPIQPLAPDDECMKRDPSSPYDRFPVPAIRARCDMFCGPVNQGDGMAIVFDPSLRRHVVIEGVPDPIDSAMNTLNTHYDPLVQYSASEFAIEKFERRSQWAVGGCLDGRGVYTRLPLTNGTRHEHSFGSVSVATIFGGKDRQQFNTAILDVRGVWHVFYNVVNPRGHYHEFIRAHTSGDFPCIAGFARNLVCGSHTNADFCDDCPAIYWKASAWTRSDLTNDGRCPVPQVVPSGAASQLRANAPRYTAATPHRSDPSSRPNPVCKPVHQPRHRGQRAAVGTRHSRNVKQGAVAVAERDFKSSGHVESAMLTVIAMVTVFVFAARTQCGYVVASLLALAVLAASAYPIYCSVSTRQTYAVTDTATSRWFAAFGSRSSPAVTVRAVARKLSRKELRRQRPSRARRLRQRLDAAGHLLVVPDAAPVSSRFIKWVFACLAVLALVTVWATDNAVLYNARTTGSVGADRGVGASSVTQEPAVPSAELYTQLLSDQAGPLPGTADWLSLHGSHTPTTDLQLCSVPLPAAMFMDTVSTFHPPACNTSSRPFAVHAYSADLHDAHAETFEVDHVQVHRNKHGEPVDRRPWHQDAGDLVYFTNDSAAEAP